LSTTYGNAYQCLHLLEKDINLNYLPANDVISSSANLIWSRFAIVVEIHNETLISIDDLCLIMFNMMFLVLGMLVLNRPMHDGFNWEFGCKWQYDRNTLSQSIRKKGPETLMIAIIDGYWRVLIIDAHGGTRKTFLILLHIASILAQIWIALTAASSEAAATLLEEGQTDRSVL